MTVNDYGNVCNSSIIYIVSLVIFLIISISISSVFIYLFFFKVLNATPLRQQFIEYIDDNYRTN